MASSSSSSSSIPAITAPPSTDYKTVLFFWAPWHEASAPGGPLDQALAVLSSTLSSSSSAAGLVDNNVISFGKVEAEVCVDLSERYGVTVVPTVVLLNRGGAVVDKIEGDDVARVTTAVQRLAKLESDAPAPIASSTTTPQSTTEQQKKDSLTDRINRLVRANDVMVFMKGIPTAPRCGFSRQAVQLLEDANIAFGSFDILSDDDVRQGLKTYSDWPTYPQIYVRGELVGGLDILKELASEDGGLRTQLGLTSSSSDESPTMATTKEEEESLDDRLKALVNRRKVMLFMKGLPSAPRCGFSRQMCDLLDNANVAYDSFDILEDDQVRQGLKTYADWPTYPMLWVNGELVGGLDICRELAESGELQELLQS